MERLEAEFGRIFYESLVKGVTSISHDILKMMEEALDVEESPPAKVMLGSMIKNVELAQKQKKGICQSPGIPCVMCDMAVRWLE